LLKIRDFLGLYQNDIITASLSEVLRPNKLLKIQLKGAAGSLDAVIPSALALHNPHHSHLFVLHDREEAAYFQNDLQNLLPKKTVHFFPASYKRPYEFEETENANVLLRTELINKLNTKTSEGEIIVSYPEALSEKVVNKKALKKHTIHLETGSSVNVNQLFKDLIEFEFEKEDFVYEPGQFALRGGIIDVFSYANELPYRIELFGDEIESIRTFDPESQLSKSNVKSIGIIPNLQTKFTSISKQSFLSFLPKNTKLWLKDVQLTLDTINKHYDLARRNFDELMAKAISRKWCKTRNCFLKQTGRSALTSKTMTSLSLEAELTLKLMLHSVLSPSLSNPSTRILNLSLKT
jgi:transcription-repair coupling factor (superfamily II helicase)